MSLWQYVRGVLVWRGSEHTSLRQSQQDVLHQHGADHHFLTVDCQLGGSFLFGRHSDQHQAPAGHRPAREPVDRMMRRRNSRTEVKAAQIESKDKATEVKEGYTRVNQQVFGSNKKQHGEQSDKFTVPHNK